MTGHEEDSDATSETEVLRPDEDTGELEGTLEMDREALIARIRADRRPSKPPGAEKSDATESRRDAETVQVPSVAEETQPTKTAKLDAVSEQTQNYDVPDSVMDELRKEELHTLDIPLEMIEEGRDDDRTTAVLGKDDLVEFTAIVDREGRVQLPESAVRGKFQPGRRIYVVMRVADD